MGSHAAPMQCQRARPRGRSCRGGSFRRHGCPLVVDDKTSWTVLALANHKPSSPARDVASCSLWRPWQLLLSCKRHKSLRSCRVRSVVTCSDVSLGNDRKDHHHGFDGGCCIPSRRQRRVGRQKCEDSFRPWSTLLAARRKSVVTGAIRWCRCMLVSILLHLNVRMGARRMLPVPQIIAQRRTRGSTLHD